MTSSGSPNAKQTIAARIPFFYGWVVVAVAFVTLAVGVNARTAYSLLYPPILQEFGWTRADTAAIFTVGFLVSAVMSPFIGMGIDRFGPRIVLPIGGLIVSAGYAASTYASALWQFYFLMGAMVVGASVTLSYIGHSAFLPNWFVRRRGLAIGIAFSGVGFGGIVMLPLVQIIIDQQGWRAACWTVAISVFVITIPLNFLLQRARPSDVGLQPDGDGVPGEDSSAPVYDNVVDRQWVETDWTLAKAMRTGRFWWLAVAFFTALFVWYGLQVHQTKYLIDIGFSSEIAALALGLVAFFGVVSQILLGYLSDRWGREWGWTIALVGFLLTFVALLILPYYPAAWLMYVMVICQGLIGYGMTPNYASIPAELFQGKHYGAIFGTLSLAAAAGGAAGPWVLGALFDQYNSYAPAFWICIALSVLSGICIWAAAPRKVRRVAGRM
jgi:MFS family permease